MESGINTYLYVKHIAEDTGVEINETENCDHYKERKINAKKYLNIYENIFLSIN